VKPTCLNLTRRAGKLSGGLLFSLVLNLLLAAGIGYVFFGAKLGLPPVPGLPVTTPQPATGGGGSTTGTPSTSGADGREVNALGRIQPGGGLISVFGPAGDRVKQFSVTVGEVVPAGKELGTLSGTADRQLQLDSLKTQISEAEALQEAIRASAKAKLADIDAEAKQAVVGVEQDTRAIDAKLKAVQANEKRARSELRRFAEAKAAGVKVSDSETEQMEALLAQAVAEAEASDAQKKKIVAVKEEGEKSVVAKKATVDAETKRALAAVPLESLKTTLRISENKLKDAELRAPSAGRVVRILTQASDTITTQPILQLADVAKMTVTAEVYETDIGKLRESLNKGPVKAEVRGSALGNDVVLQGTVKNANSISTVISKNVLTPLGPREDADRRVVEVEVELNADASKQAANYIGLQVRVKFLP
jgi:HlyD family secretion protein